MSHQASPSSSPMMWRNLATLDTTALQLFMGLQLALVWGIVLLLPYDTFGGNLAFSAMSSLASETVWGVIGLLAGLLQVSAVLGYWRSGGQRWLAARKIGAAFSCAAYVFIATMYMISSPKGLAFWTYALCGVADMWIVWQLGEPGHHRD